MSTVPQPPHDQEPGDFGAGGNGQAPKARRLRADERVAKRWEGELAQVNKARQRPLELPSPLDVAPAIWRTRALPRMPWPVEWGGLAERCRTYPGDIVTLVGGPGSGKTQWGVQLGRAFVAAARGCVLWLPLELTPVDISLRIAANLTRRHVAEIRDSWPEQQIEAALVTVTDRWRFIGRERTLADQLEACRASAVAAERVYGGKPLLVIDYGQKLAQLADDRLSDRGRVSATLEALRLMTESIGCYTILLSQVGRHNQPALAGRVDQESATDAIGVGAESAEFENASATQIALNVFKADDATELDVHQLVTKARHTGREGKVGARYVKAGGVWEEVDHLPATPLEVTAEVKRSRKRSAEDGGPVAAPAARAELNTARIEEAAGKRRTAVITALRDAGDHGLSTGELRKARGTGSARTLASMLVELEGAGRVKMWGGRWAFLG